MPTDGMTYRGLDRVFGETYRRLLEPVNRFTPPEPDAPSVLDALGFVRCSCRWFTDDDNQQRRLAAPGCPVHEAR